MGLESLTCSRQTAVQSGWAVAELGSSSRLCRYYLWDKLCRSFVLQSNRIQSLGTKPDHYTGWLAHWDDVLCRDLILDRVHFYRFFYLHGNQCMLLVWYFLVLRTSSSDRKLKSCRMTDDLLPDDGWSWYPQVCTEPVACLCHLCSFAHSAYVHLLAIRHRQSSCWSAVLAENWSMTIWNPWWDSCLVIISQSHENLRETQQRLCS